MAVTAPTTTWTYDADGNMLSETDPLGNTTSTSYDGWNRAVSTTDALGNTTTTAYDPWNNVVAVTDPLGRTTQYVYNNQGEKIEQIAPDPDDYTATGGTNGTLVSPTTYYGFDAAGNLSYVTEPLGAGERWRHGSGRPCIHHLVFLRRLEPPDVGSRCPGGHELSERRAARHAAQGQHAHHVRLRGQRLESDAGRQRHVAIQTTTYQYDALGRKFKEIDADPSTGRRQRQSDDDLRLRPQRQCSFHDRPERPHDLDGLRRLEPPDQDRERRRQRP